MFFVSLKVVIVVILKMHYNPLQLLQSQKNFYVHVQLSSPLTLQDLCVCKMIVPGGVTVVGQVTPEMLLFRRRYGCA